MNHLLITATASAMLLAACGDDSSTNASGNTLTRTGSLFVDEEHQLIVITPDPYYENKCVLEGEALTWKNVQQHKDADSMKYEFHGDTLLFYNIDEGDTSHYGEMWVGVPPEKSTEPGHIHIVNTIILKMTPDATIQSITK